MRIAITEIRIDGGTQPRASLNEDVVAEYAEAIQSGSILPQVIVFHDGKDYWLADGFHRYHAHRHAGSKFISADVRNGTKRDAVLYSVGANASHGLRRTNEDKRRAVMTLLNDEEWSQWSARDVARSCLVSSTFVDRIKSSLQTVCSETGPKEVKYTTKHGTTATMRTANGGKKSAGEQGAEPKTVNPVSENAPENAPEYYGPSEQELAESAKAIQEELESMQRVIDADDKTAAAMAEAKRYREENRILKERVNGLMNEKNEAVRLAKSMRRKLDAYEKAAA